MSFLRFNLTYYCKGKVRKFISISNSTEQKTKESSSLTRRILQSAAARGRVQVVQPRSEWTSSCASSARATVPPCHRATVCLAATGTERRCRRASVPPRRAGTERRPAKILGKRPTLGRVHYFAACNFHFTNFVQKQRQLE